MADLHGKTVLILDDDEQILETIKLVFEELVGTVLTSSDPREVITLLDEKQVDLVIMDMNYTRGSVNGNEGLELLKDIRSNDPSIPVIVMTAYGEIELVVECMKLGAVDFIQKPWSNQRLLVTAHNTLASEDKSNKINQLKAQNAYLKKESNAHLSSEMIGSSNAMMLLRAKIEKVAASDANVLILGENGTGKELVAKAIHKASQRHRSSFVRIDLGSISENLFEAEMFGATKGAYTGSHEEKPGRMLLAHNGTLLLDEIGNLPLSMQSKLLSVLQNREVIAVGATKPQPINIRLLAATNMTINQLLDDQVFRQDLLYRINTVELQIPPLRERSEDIPELIANFKKRYEIQYNKPSLEVRDDTIQHAKAYHWPGNVRELQHAVERAVLLSNGGAIRTSDLIPPVRTNAKANHPADFNLERMEKDLIRKALQIHQGNMTKAAADLGLTRAALYRRLEKYGL